MVVVGKRKEMSGDGGWGKRVTSRGENPIIMNIYANSIMKPIIVCLKRMARLCTLCNTLSGKNERQRESLDDGGFYLVWPRGELQGGL